MKKVLKRVGDVLLAVVHDRAVQRSARTLAILAIARMALAAGASAEVVSLLQKLAG